MARFTLPRDIYHGKGCIEELKNLKGKRAILVVGVHPQLSVNRIEIQVLK